MKIEAPRVQFDREKFKEVVHYVCAKTPPEKLGNVKLHKVLYFSDMLFYVQHARPITGASYQKQQFGPTARYLTAALRQLEQDGALQVAQQEYYGFLKKAYISRRDPNLARTSDEERAFIDTVIDFVCDHSAKEISDLSHTQVWELAQMGEDLPYYTALSFYPAEITDDDMAWGTEEAQKLASAG